VVGLLAGKSCGDGAPFRVRARLWSLLKKSSEGSLVTGHDFSRAVRRVKDLWALATAEMSPQFDELVQRLYDDGAAATVTGVPAMAGRTSSVGHTYTARRRE